MGVFKRGRFWWYRFKFEKRLIQQSCKTTNKQLALRAEEEHKRELRDGLIGVDSRKLRGQSLHVLAQDYLEAYRLEHARWKFLQPAVRNFDKYLGGKTVGQIDVQTVANFQTALRKRGLSTTTVNMHVGILLRVLGIRGDQLRGELKRQGLRTLKPKKKFVGKSFSVDEQDRLLAAARESTSPHLYFALQLALNGGMRDLEIKTLKWEQIDFTRNILTVGKSKTDAGTGRLVPLNEEILPAFLKHREWYVQRFKELRPEWYVFAFGKRGRMDPTKHVATLHFAWAEARKRAGVTGCWHDLRHTVVTQLSESGATPAAIKASIGHVSQQMLDRYSHANIDSQRRAFDNLKEYREQQRERLRKAAAVHAKAKQHETHATVH